MTATVDIPSLEIAESQPRVPLEKVPPEHPSAEHLNSFPGVDNQPWRFACIIVSLLLGTFLLALDETILSTAIPSVTSEFHSLDDIAWYSAGYIVSLTALQPSFGKLYRLLNIKWVYLACIAVFEVGSIICAAAPSSPIFIVGRAIAGCGGAGLLQGALAIITNTVVLEKRPLYSSVILSAFVVCVCIGPVLGGVFTQYTTWRWCFWINVPIGTLVFVLVLIFLRLKRNEAQERFKAMKLLQKLQELDLLGTLLVIGGTVCLLLALQWAGISHPWKSSPIIGLLIGAGLFACTFCALQHFLGAKAMLPVSILRQRSIIVSALFLFFYAMPTYILAYYIPIYFQSAKGTTPIASAVNFLAVGIPQIVAVTISGGLTTKFGLYVPYMIGGSAVSAIGAGFITTIGIETTTATWAGIFFIYALGTGFAINVPYTAVQASLSEEDVPTGNAVLQFFFQLGAAIGLSISQTIFLNKLEENVREKLPEVNPSAVIRAGAYHLDRLSSSGVVLRMLREAYSKSLSTLFVFPLVAVCVAVYLTLIMEHKNIKKIAEDRRSRLRPDGQAKGHE